MSFALVDLAGRRVCGEVIRDNHHTLCMRFSAEDIYGPYDIPEQYVGKSFVLKRHTVKHRVLLCAQRMTKEFIKKSDVRWRTLLTAISPT